MKTPMNRSFAIVLIASALSPAAPAFADIFNDTTLSLGSDYIYGNCSVSVSTDEKAFAFSSACNLDKNEITIQGYPLPDYDIGYPRETHFSEMWHIMRPGAPQANARYCTRFGLMDEPGQPLYVAWEFVDLPFGSYVRLEGDQRCKTAEPKVKAYYQTFCIGAYVWVYSVDSLIPGVHLSYRIAADPLICHAVATRPDT